MLDREEFDTLKYLLLKEVDNAISQLDKTFKHFRENITRWKKTPGIGADQYRSYPFLIQDEIDFLQRMVKKGPYSDEQKNVGKRNLMIMQKLLNVSLIVY